MSLESLVTAMLEPLCESRVYRLTLPPAAQLPAISYQRISTVRGYAHDGDDQLPVVRLQLDCWAADPDEADALVDSVVATFTGYSDDTLQRVQVEEDREMDEPDSSAYRRTVDLLVAYAEAAGS